MNLTLHWRILVAAVAALMLAAFVLPPLVPPPDLKENRKLAPAPAWPTDLAKLKTLRADVDAYVADRFPARAQLIALFNYARMPFGVSGSPRVIVGKQGWLFYDDGTHLGPVRGDPPLSDADAQAWLSGLAGRTEFLKAQGVPYIVVTAPLKETIYPEQGPRWYAGPAADRPSVRLATLAARSGAGEVIHFYAPLADAKAAGVKAYGPNDTHWSGAGAYAAYVVLMRRLEGLGLGEPPRPISDFKPVGERPRRDLAQMLGVGHLVTVNETMLADSLVDQRHKVIWLTDRRDRTAPRMIETGEVGKPILLITVDSFSTALLPFLYSHFSRLIITHNDDGPWRDDLIARFEPDLVILEVVESGLRHVMAVSPPPSAETLTRIAQAVAAPGPPPAAVVRGRMVKLDSQDAVLRILSDAEPAAGCNFDLVRLEPGGALRLEGWISPLGKRPAPGAGMVRLSGKAGSYVAAIRTDGRRPDVAAAFANPMAESSGFVEEVALSELPPGVYEVFAYRRVRTRWIYCHATRTIEVARPGGTAQ